MNKFLLQLGILLLLCGTVFAQTRQVTGQVTDQDTKELILGAGVGIKGTSQGTQTDVNGKFKLNLPASGTTVLTITYIGYKKKEISVPAGQNVVNITIEAEATQLNEVVAVGFATVKRRDLTGSVSSVTAKQLQDIPINSAGEALAGRLAGVQVTKSEGSPDADIRIRVRGGGSVTQDNSPLFVIDGVQVENGLNSLSPQDIESIDVLKDAASTAIYGARGANGVVIVTTKGGHAQKTAVTYSGHYDVSKLAKELSVLNPYDFIVYQYERSRGNATDSTTFVKDYGHTFDTLNVYKSMPFADWQKLALGRTGTQQTHNISIAGGDKNTQFNISYTNNQQKAIVVNSGYSRNLISLRFDHTASEKLKVGFNTRYNSQLVNGVGVSNNSSSTYNNLRNSVKYRPFNFNGVPDDQIDPSYYLETNAAGNNFGVLNPITLSNAQYRKNYTTVLNLNGHITYAIEKYLTFTSTLGFDFNNVKQKSFDDATTPNAMINGAGQPLAGLNTQGLNTSDLSNVLTFSNASFKPTNHNVTVIVGNEFYNIHAEGINQQYKLFPVGISPVNALNQFAIGTPVLTYPQITNYTSHVLSFFTRANYDYNKKYLAAFTFRTDQSSKFADGKRNGYFPSGSLAWRISDEDFMKNNKVVSDMKLRLSYGTSGNNRIDDYLFESAFGANALYGLNETTVTNALTPAYLPNPNLKWETTISRNIGLDFSILNSRIQVSVDAYRNTTNDLLIKVPVPTTSGYATQLQNVGKTENTGLEVQLNSYIVQNKNFTWSANLNMSYNNNKVLALAPGQTSYFQGSGWGPSGQPADFIVQVGQPVGSVYGYTYDGFYQVSDFNYNAANNQYTLKAGVADPSKVQGIAQPGLIKYKDINGDGVITDADRGILGNTIPKITGGLNQQFTFKHFDMSVFMNFQLNAKTLNANKIEFTNGYTANTNILGYEVNRWRTTDASGNVVQKIVTPTGSTTPVAVGVAPDQLQALNANAKYPIPVTGSAAFYLTSDALENAAFLRINNVSLGYTFTGSGVLKKVGVSKLRIYVTANNLALFTPYSGYDPDVNTRRATSVTPGVDYSAYPSSRTYTFGVNLSL
ncbi:MAG: TonB-dependent receptor [Bacteroidota bacterium]